MRTQGTTLSSFCLDQSTKKQNVFIVSDTYGSEVVDVTGPPCLFGPNSAHLKYNADTVYFHSQKGLLMAEFQNGVQRLSNTFSGVQCSEQMSRNLSSSNLHKKSSTPTLTTTSGGTTMAKRFTESDKWKKTWYRELGSKLRDLRQYLLDTCDHAGIWEIDYETAKHFIGAKITRADVSAALRHRLVEFDGDKIFIPDFIDFQYGTLREDVRPHQSVIKVLKKHSLFEGYTKGIHTLKDKDKDQDQDKDKDKNKDKDKEPAKIPRLAEIWNKHCGPVLTKVESTNADRNKRSKLRLAEHGEEKWATAVEKIAASNFCNGKNDKAWIADFDWILQPAVFLKVMEGKYDNRIAHTKQTLAAAEKLEWLSGLEGAK